MFIKLSEWQHTEWISLKFRWGFELFKTFVCQRYTQRKVHPMKWICCWNFNQNKTPAAKKAVNMTRYAFIRCSYIRGHRCKMADKFMRQTFYCCFNKRKNGKKRKTNKKCVIKVNFKNQYVQIASCLSWIRFGIFHFSTKLSSFIDVDLVLFYSFRLETVDQ